MERALTTEPRMGAECAGLGGEGGSLTVPPGHTAFPWHLACSGFTLSAPSSEQVLLLLPAHDTLTRVALPATATPGSHIWVTLCCSGWFLQVGELPESTTGSGHFSFLIGVELEMGQVGRGWV